VTDAQLPDLVAGLIKVRDAQGRFDECGETVPYVAELTAVVHNQGDAIADETTTLFWIRGADIDRELRVIYTRRARRSRSPRCGTSAAAAAST
jgi:hypothetical protein